MNNILLLKNIRNSFLFCFLFSFFFVFGITYADDGNNPEELAQQWIDEMIYYEDISRHIYIDYPSSWFIDVQTMDTIYFITFVSDYDFYYESGIGFAMGSTILEGSESLESIWQNFVSILVMDIEEYKETSILGVQVLHSTYIDEYMNVYNKIFVYIIDGKAYMILATISPESLHIHYKQVVEEMVFTAFVDHPALKE
jgi:hypothetical protein